MHNMQFLECLLDVIKIGFHVFCCVFFFFIYLYILLICCICSTLSDENSWAWKLYIASLKESHYIYTCITLCCIWPVRCVKDVERREERFQRIVKGGPIGRGSNILSCIQCFSSDTISAATCCVLHACLIENNGVKELCQMSAEWIKEKWPHTHLALIIQSYLEELY